MRKVTVLCLISILLGISILGTGCHTSRHAQNETGMTVYSKEESESDMIRRSGNQLLWHGNPLTLRAVNFDNLTWFSEPEPDGIPIYTYHHSEEDYDVVKSLGFNSVRFFLRWQDLYEDESCTTRKESGWDWLENNIRWSEEREIFLIIDFHCPAGGFGSAGEDTWPIWTDDSVQDAFFRAWKDIAAACVGESFVVGYDLMNEPSVPEKGTSLYRDLLTEAIRVIREEDPDHVLIVEAITGIEGDPESYSRPTWVQFEDPNLMYSFHFYEPIPFTHPEADSTDSVSSYPDDRYGADTLRSSLDAMIAPAFLSEVPIFLGEFGCMDWSEGNGSDQWISDIYQWCEEQCVHTGLFTYRSFADVSSEEDYGFGIYRMQTGGDFVLQSENQVLIDLLLEIGTIPSK